MLMYSFEDNLPPLSEPVVHKKCVRFAGEEEEDKKSHLEEKKLKQQKTRKEKKKPKIQ